MLVVITLLFLLLGRAVLWPLDTALKLLPAAAPVSIDSFLVGGAAALGIVEPTSDVPVTLVALDDELYTQWGRPCSTPRSEIAKLIDALAAQGPSAIVIDINFDCATGVAACPADADPTCDFGSFLATYAGPPLILVRGMYLDALGTGEQRVRVSRTAYEDAVASNPRIHWAHTFYLTDADGTVRRWRDAWEACNDGDTTETLLAVPIWVTVALRGEASLATAPPRTGDCTFTHQTSPEHLVVLGSPIVGQPIAPTVSTAPRVVPARFLIDAERGVEAGGYYSVTGRVAIVGATHTAAGDMWRTAIGLIPGMELIGHTVRFAPTQLDYRATAGQYSSPIVIASLWVLAIAAFALRPSLAVFFIAVVSFGAIAIATRAARFDVFESMELSLLLFIEYMLAFAFWTLYREVKNYRGLRTLRLVMSKRMRSRDPETK